MDDAPLDIRIPPQVNRPMIETIDRYANHVPSRPDVIRRPTECGLEAPKSSARVLR